jgi:hypothetical protein
VTNLYVSEKYVPHIAFAFQGIAGEIECPPNYLHVRCPCHDRLFDVSKQVVGQMFVHGVNVFISDVGVHALIWKCMCFLLSQRESHSNRYHSWCVSLHFSLLRISHALYGRCRRHPPCPPAPGSHGSSPTSSNLRAFSPGNTALHPRSIIGRARPQSMSSPSLPWNPS